MNKIETEAWVHEETDSCQRGAGGVTGCKEGEGISPKHTWHIDTDSVVMARGKGSGGWEEVGKGGENGDT